MYGGVHFSDCPDPDNISVMDHQMLPMIRDMHRYGIRLDVPLLQSLTKQITESQAEIEFETQIHIGAYRYRHPKHGLEPFKIGSRDHLSQLLFEELKIQGDDSLNMTPKGKRFEVSEEVMWPFKDRHPVVPGIIEWHKIEKLKNTYTATLPLMVDSDSRLHTSFNVTVAATGRLSSSNPNLQNIPIRTELGKEIRSAFIASPYCVLVSADLSQIEMRWAAHRSQDPVMMEAFVLDQDIHIRTACAVFGYDYDEVTALFKLAEEGNATTEQIAWVMDFKQFKRYPCKHAGFGVLYGVTPEGFHDKLLSDGIDWPLERCVDFIENKFYGVYNKLRLMLENDYRTVKRYALIWDDFGRVRLVPEAKSTHKRIANEGARKAGNHPEQSGAQGTIKLAMAELIPLYKKANTNGTICRPLLQIHDQLIFETSAGFAEEWAGVMKEVMEHASPLSIPVRSSSDIGCCWKDL